MRKHSIRTTALAATVLAAALSLTACQGEDANAGAAQSTASSASASAGAGTPTAGADASQSADSASNGSTSNGKGSGNGSGDNASGGGDKSGYGQVCGANDIAWSTKSETQAGGYILIMAKAKSGITCVLPAALPTVAFGSDGTEAGPAEQAVGEQVTLSGSTTAYAGVNTKSTSGNGGKELDFIIVGVGDNDPNPVSLPVGKITVEDPIVTNWHTSPADAVPFSS